MTHREAADALAGAFLAGTWTEERLVARGAQALAPRPRWLRRVVRAVLAAHPRPPRDAPRALAAAVAAQLPERLGPVRVVRAFVPGPAAGRRRFPAVPELATVEALAALVGHDPDRLLWLADVPSLERRSPAPGPGRHYRYRWRRRDGGPVRLIEAPKPLLRDVQRRLLDAVLVHVPPHDAAHGFVRGRSAITHARAHVGRRVVIGFDLEDFFASVPAGRVFATYRTAGFPEGVAHVLTALAVNVVPGAEWAAVPRPRDLRALTAHARLGRRLATPHLPQGAPTSPALANLAAHALDRRLAGVAAAFDAIYTRYADDLAFSGGPGVLRRATGLRAAVADVVADEGLRLNERKSHLTTDAGRQHVCGIVVNARPNVTRPEYDRLKAVLHNAGRDGPGDLDREHLLGRIAWVASLNPDRGDRLRERFARVAWP